MHTQAPLLKNRNATAATIRSKTHNLNNHQETMQETEPWPVWNPTGVMCISESALSLPIRTFPASPAIGTSTSPSLTQPEQQSTQPWQLPLEAYSLSETQLNSHQPQNNTNTDNDINSHSHSNSQQKRKCNTSSSNPNTTTNNNNDNSQTTTTTTTDVTMDRSFLTRFAVDPRSFATVRTTAFSSSANAAPTAIPSPVQTSGNRQLPVGYIPSKYDVICGRGKDCFNHIGNRRFRVTIAINLKTYLEAKNKIDKSMVVNAIVDQVREASPQGGFVKLDRQTGTWYALDADGSREKVGHAMRDAISASQSAVRKIAASEANQGKTVDMRRLSLCEAQNAIFASLAETRTTPRRKQSSSSSAAKSKKRRRCHSVTARA